MTNLVRLTRTIGHNSDTVVRLGTVTAEPPELEIKLDGQTDLLEADDVIVSEHLTNYKRHISLKKSTDDDYETSIRLASTSITDDMTSAGSGPHKHDITEIEMANVEDDFTIDEVEVEFLNELKEGDRVVCLAYETSYGTQYLILDRVVIYNAD